MKRHKKSARQFSVDAPVSFLSAADIEAILSESPKMQARSRVQARTMDDIARLTHRERHLLGVALHSHVRRVRNGGGQ